MRRKLLRPRLVLPSLRIENKDVDHRFIYMRVTAISDLKIRDFTGRDRAAA